MGTKTLKRIPPYFLAGGASLILGLLSFGGMFALTPVWPLALGTLVLAVAYDYEIYQQNMSGAFNKLFFVRNYLQHHLAREFLKHHFPLKDPNNALDNRPEFFKQYEQQLLMLHDFEHKPLNKDAKKRKKNIERNLRHLEAWFTKQLFLKSKKTTPHDIKDNALGIPQWLDELKKPNSKKSLRDEVQETLRNRHRLFYAVGAFSVLSAGFMTVGTTYLLSQTVALIPLLATISAAMPPATFLIIALTAGVAYGFLTYNAITDMINHQTIQRFIAKILLVYTEGLSVRHVLITLSTLLIITLAVGLTICTAGTWWTIAKEAAPLFSWLLKLPHFIMGIINPIITAISSLSFNIENTTETMALLENIEQSPLELIQEKFSELKTVFQTLPKQENWGQILNPARFILKVTMTPLRMMLFLGHLISIAATGDRVPGFSEITSIIFGIVSEGFEDGHYFAGHHHHESEACKLISMEANPSDASLKKLLRNSSAIYILINHEFRYYTKENNTFHATLVTQDPTILSQLTQHLTPGKKAKQLSETDLTLIQTLTQHVHRPSISSLVKERLASAHGHNHHDDFPTKVLKLCFFPIYKLATLWDWAASQFNPKISPEAVGRQRLSYAQARARQEGHSHHHDNEHEHDDGKEHEPMSHQEEIAIDNADQVSPLEWSKESTIMQIEEFQQEHFSYSLIDRKLAKSKSKRLTTLKDTINNSATSTAEIKEKIIEAANDHCITTSRNYHFFGSAHKKTTTTVFLTHLAQEIRS